MIIGTGMRPAGIGSIPAATLLRILLAALPVAAAAVVGLAVVPWPWLLGAGALAGVAVYAATSR